MKIVEAWGTGIPRIISRCKEYGLQEPLFEELGDGFMVTMFRKPTNQTNQSNLNDIKKNIMASLIIWKIRLLNCRNR